MTIYVVAAIVAALVYALEVYVIGQQFEWGDAREYAKLGRGEPASRPFQRRWLLPAVCIDRKRRWRWATGLACIALGPLMAAYAGGGAHGLLGAWFYLLLPGVVFVAAHCPALVDAPAMACALGSAVAHQRGHDGLALALAALSGACKEAGPVFAALWAWHPLPLAGIVAVNWWPEMLDPRPPLRARLRAIWDRRKVRQQDLRDPWITLTPWGAVLPLAALGAAWDRATLVAAVSLAVGYMQLFIAHDRARLFQWAAPPVIVVALRAPEWALSLGALVQWYTPRSV